MGIQKKTFTLSCQPITNEHNIDELTQATDDSTVVKDVHNLGYKVFSWLKNVDENWSVCE